MERPVQGMEFKRELAELSDSLATLMGELAGLRAEIERGLRASASARAAACETMPAGASGLSPVARIVHRTAEMSARMGIPVAPKAEANHGITPRPVDRTVSIVR